MSENLNSPQKFDKSILHHWLCLSKDSSFDFIRLIDYLKERDFGVLDIALSEKALRPLYINLLARYYATHEIIIAKYPLKKCHLDWIFKRGLNMHVQKLSIGFNESKTRINFDEYVLNFPELLEIKCWDITNSIFDMLSTYSPKLRSFKTFSVFRLNDYKKIENFFSKCTQLKCIHISDHPARDCVRLDDRIILPQIVKYCPQLEVLKLIDWANIEEGSISALATLSYLRELNIDCFDVMSSDSLVRLVSNNKRLESLSFQGMCWSHNDVMVAIGASCPLLKHVSLSTCYWREFGDEGVIAMVRGCPLLETIELACFNAGPFMGYGDESEDEEVYIEPVLSFTDASLRAIAQYCPLLEILKVISVDPLSYTKAGLETVVASCPRLRALHTGEKALFHKVQGYVADDYDSLYYGEGGY